MSFVDRVVEHPGRIRLTMVEEDVYDVTREEGTVTTEGTELSAENLNSELAGVVADRLLSLSFTDMSDMETQWSGIVAGAVYAFHGSTTWTSETATDVGGAYQANGLFMPVSQTNADMLFSANGHLWYGRHTRGTVASGDFTRVI